jgi:hypothetical protein
MWSLENLHTCLDSGRVVWRKHALGRLMERGISRSAVMATLRQGDILETYETDRPFPSALVAVAGDNPLHVVAAVDSMHSECFVISAYIPDLLHFEPDLKTRRKP